MDFPTFKEAVKLGYNLYSYSGDKTIVTYFKDKVCLTIYDGKEAELHSTYKMIQLKTGKFSFPHKNFYIFENQILHLLNGVK